MKAKRARYKTGRVKTSMSFSISQSQIDWLNEHPQINNSHLVSSLLEEYIDAYNATQPEKVKLILRLRALKIEQDKAEKELGNAEYTFRHVKGNYDTAFEYLTNLRYIGQLPLEQLKINFDELNNPDIAFIHDSEATNKFDRRNVSIKYYGQKEPAQIYALLKKKLEEAESTAYQTKLEWLKRDIELPESIYNAFKQNYENISKQIGEIEKSIVKQE
jgi:hypothetical protein